MSAGWRGSAGQVRRRQLSPHRTTGKIFHGCRLRRGRAMPGSWGLAAIGKKSCRSSPHRRTGFFFPGNAARTECQPAEHPLSPGSLLYVLYVLYLTRQATEHPLPPGSLLYVLYVLYLTRQATEHPLSPGSMLYVLYVLYGPISLHYIVQISRVQNI